MNLFLTSVSDTVRDIDYLKNNINNETKLVILPLAHDFNYISCEEDLYIHYDRDPFNKDSIFWRTVRPFIDIGIHSENIVVINVYTDPYKIIELKLLDKNTIVFIPGGFPENIVKTLKRFKLCEVIKQCNTVVGESAGSMFWSRTYFVYPDNDYKKYQCFKGIKLIKDFVVIPHYNPDNDKISKALKRFRKFHNKVVYLVPDGGWVWYDTNSKRIIEQHSCTLY